MKKAKPLIIFIIFFLAWLFLISLLWKYPYLLLLILSVSSISYFLITKSLKEFNVYVIAAIAGPFGESVVSASGLWTYHGALIFGIPYWLPFAWGITAVAVYKLISEVEK